MNYLTQEELVSVNVLIQSKTHQSSGLRDASALNYICASAEQEVFGQRLYDTPIKLSVFYFIKLIKKHVFNDANKLTAYTCLILSLKRNGEPYQFSSDDQKIISDLAIHVATVNGESDELRKLVTKTIEDILKKYYR